MLNRNSELVICSRFVNCVLWSCDMNSTLGSVVPLAMFMIAATDCNAICGAVFYTQQTVNFIHRKEIKNNEEKAVSKLNVSNRIKIQIISGADWFAKRSALATSELISNFPNMDLTSNPASSTFHTQPPTNRTLVQGTNYNQPKTKLSQGTNLTKPAYLHYPLHHPPVGSLLLLQGELWIEAENIFRKKTSLSRSFKSFSNTEGKALIWVQGSGKA